MTKCGYTSHPSMRHELPKYRCVVPSEAFDDDTHSYAGSRDTQRGLWLAGLPVRVRFTQSVDAWAAFPPLGAP